MGRLSPPVRRQNRAVSRAGRKNLPVRYHILPVPGLHAGRTGLESIPCGLTAAPVAHRSGPYYLTRMGRLLPPVRRQIISGAACGPYGSRKHPVRPHGCTRGSREWAVRVVKTSRTAHGHNHGSLAHGNGPHG